MSIIQQRVIVCHRNGTCWIVELRAMLKSYGINIETSETMKYFKAALRKKQMEQVSKDTIYRRAWSAWYSDADRIIEQSYYHYDVYRTEQWVATHYGSSHRSTRRQRKKYHHKTCCTHCKTNLPTDIDIKWHLEELKMLTQMSVWHLKMCCVCSLFIHTYVCR